MDESFYGNTGESTVKKVDKGEGLATASLILGLVAALGFVFVVPPFVCGATAIVLAFLSVSDNGMSFRAKIGMFMGILSIVLLIVIMVSAVNYLMTNPGIFDSIYKEFDGSFEELYNELLNGEGGYI